VSSYRLLQELRGARSVLDDASATGASVDVMLDLAKQVTQVAAELDGEGAKHVGRTFKRSAGRYDTRVCAPSGQWETPIENARWVRAYYRSWKELRQATMKYNFLPYRPIEVPPSTDIESWERWFEARRQWGRDIPRYQSEPSEAVRRGDEVHHEIERDLARRSETSRLESIIERSMRDALNGTLPDLAAAVRAEPLDGRRWYRHADTESKLRGLRYDRMIVDDPHAVVELDA
jgi:hypothetical protein